MAVIAVTPGVPLQNITAEIVYRYSTVQQVQCTVQFSTAQIVYSLSEMGTAICITPEVVKNSLGFNALDPSNDFKLTAWLGAQEDHYNTVIYLCDDHGQLTRSEYSPLIG